MQYSLESWRREALIQSHTSTATEVVEMLSSLPMPVELEGISVAAECSTRMRPVPRGGDRISSRPPGTSTGDNMPLSAMLREEEVGDHVNSSSRQSRRAPVSRLPRTPIEFDEMDHVTPIQPVESERENINWPRAKARGSAAHAGSDGSQQRGRESSASHPGTKTESDSESIAVHADMTSTPSQGSSSLPAGESEDQPVPKRKSRWPSYSLKSAPQTSPRSGPLERSLQLRTELEQKLSAKEKEFGPHHLEVGLTLGALASINGSLGDVNQQKDLLERALSIYEREYGERSR